MTVKELAQALLDLPEEQQELPACFWDSLQQLPLEITELDTVNNVTLVDNENNLPSEMTSIIIVN